MALAPVEIPRFMQELLVDLTNSLQVQGQPLEDCKFVLTDSVAS